MNRITQEQADAMAAWWANSFREGKKDIGATTESGKMTELLLANQVKPVSEAALARFREVFARSLVHSRRQTITTDYGPEEVLGVAMDRAGIPRGNAPAKTAMWVFDDEVVVHLGYAGNREVVWSKPEDKEGQHEVCCPIC
jgi:hypothetical protein